MKYIIFIFISFLLLSCSDKDTIYEHVILQENQLNVENFKTIKNPEKALLTGYLFVYGNECNGENNTNKCKILKELKIENECDASHLQFLKKWFKKDVIMSLKLQKCPVLPAKFAIQNKIKKIVIKRNKDTLSITIKVIGMNTSQEKNWNITQTDSFVVKNNSFIKIKK